MKHLHETRLGNRGTIGSNKATVYDSESLNEVSCWETNGMAMNLAEA